MLDPTKNNTEKATAVISNVEQYRDIYAILEQDEHCYGGIHMVGQVHILRGHGNSYKQPIDVSLWLEIQGCNPIWPHEQYDLEIKDAVTISNEVDQSTGVKYLINKHLDELLETGRWRSNPIDYPLDTESGWIRALEEGDLIVIKQTL